MTSSSIETVVDVTMPQMGVSVAEGTIVAWRVAVGDHIEAEQTICEISTDKIDTEVPAPTTGVVAEILVGVEETVPVGAVLARLTVSRGANAAPAGGGADAAPGGGGADAASAGAEANAAPGGAEADAAPSIPADNHGALTHHDASDSGTPARVADHSRTAPSNGTPRYSPVVQRIAAEHGIDLSVVAGTGRGGRVRKQDVLAAVAAASTPEPPLHIESPYRPDPPPVAPTSQASAGQLSRMRRQIGAHMKRSLETAATCTTWIEADMTRVQAARTRLGVTALSFVASATIAGLREHPQLNSTLEGERYTQHSDVNLGIAVSLGEDGLIVPVIHRAHELSVEGLAARIRDLAGRARSKELTPDEVSGATFTITNPGQYGSIMATPIISQPQVGILDLEAIVKRPVVVTDAEGNDSIAIRAMTILGLSWDHRALDGALSAQFLATVKRELESV